MIAATADSKELTNMIRVHRMFAPTANASVTLANASVSPQSRTVLRWLPQHSTVEVLFAASLLGIITGCTSCSATDGIGPGPSPNGIAIAWHQQTAASANRYWFGTPAVADGRVFVEDVNRIVALDASSGAVIWSTQIKSTSPNPGAENIIVQNGSVFASESNVVAALRESDGEVLWRFQPDSNAAQVGISADDRAVYTGQNATPIVYALAIADGHLLWRVNLGQAQGWQFRADVTGVAVSGDTVFTGVNRYKTLNGGRRSGVVVALDRNTGAELWRYETPTESDDMQGRPVVAADALIVNDFYGAATIALDRATGRERWRVKSTGAGFGPLAPATVNGNHVYIGSEDNYIYDVSLASGQVFWKSNTGSSLDGVTACGASVWGMNGGLERHAATDGHQTGHYADGDARFTSNLTTDGTRVYMTGYGGVYAVKCN